jgi:hypothetical protein
MDFAEFSEGESSEEAPESSEEPDSEGDNAEGKESDDSTNPDGGKSGDVSSPEEPAKPDDEDSKEGKENIPLDPSGDLRRLQFDDELAYEDLQYYYEELTAFGSVYSEYFCEGTMCFGYDSNGEKNWDELFNTECPGTAYRMNYSACDGQCGINKWRWNTEGCVYDGQDGSEGPIGSDGEPYGPIRDDREGCSDHWKMLVAWHNE